MVEYCREHGIAHEVCGKVIVAVDDAERARLDELERRCHANGVRVEATVSIRYRLAGITKAIGYDLTHAHDAQTVRTALAFHRLGPVARATLRP